MNLDIIIRRIKKNRLWFGLNVLGLSIAFACSILVFSFTRNELSYDKFHTKAERICRFTQNTNTGKSSMIDARVWNGWAANLKAEFPQIQDYVRISSFRNGMVTINENTFYTKKAFCVDSSFFKVFDYELLLGNKELLFKLPNQLVITESIALTYFGNLDVLGKKIKLKHQRAQASEEFIISGVLKDFPENSHFKADFLCTMNESIESWSYTYFFLAPDVDGASLQQLIQNSWNVAYLENNFIPIVELQPITNIHLYSHKSRELEPNGNVITLYLLCSGALMLLIIALLNFANLNYVQYISEQKNFRVKSVNGATRISLAMEFLKESLVLMALVVGLGLIIAFYLSNLFNFKTLVLLPQTEIVGIMLLFLVIVSLFAALPFLYRPTNQLSVVPLPQKRRSFKIVVILQLMLSIIAITSTLFLQKQINYINLLHPNANNANLVVIPDNPQHVVANYETLKEQVLKHPEIKEVCAVMEEPAGIVTDNFYYNLEGDISDERKTINLLCIDSNFFSFFDIKPLAGTLNLGTTTTLKWEEKAIQLGELEDNKGEIPAGLKDEIIGYREKYIVNRMALSHLGIANPKDAIGKTFQLDFQMKYLFPPGEIVGVVDDFHYTNMYVKEKPLVMVARKMFCHCFLFRIDENNTGAALAALKTEWTKLNPNAPFEYEFVTESYQKVYRKEYNQMRVILTFAILSMLLSAMGLFAMVSFNLKMQVKEIGVRRVNGATILEIMQMLNSSFIKWVAVAFIMAVPLSYYAMQKWLESFAYKTTLSWWVFALAGLLALGIALLTVSWQTLRAARKNPVEALRYE